MNAQLNQASSTQNDRIMAALAHITVILPVTGIIAPIIIWATQREKSEYVAFQALQAVAYQLILVLAFFVGMVVYMGSFFVFIPFSGASRGFPVFMLVPFAVMGAMMIGSLVFIVYGLIAAVMVLQGRDFRYFIIGNQLKKYLQGANGKPAEG